RRAVRGPRDAAGHRRVRLARHAKGGEQDLGAAGHRPADLGRAPPRSGRMGWAATGDANATRSLAVPPARELTSPVSMGAIPAEVPALETEVEVEASAGTELVPVPAPQGPEPEPESTAVDTHCLLFLMEEEASVAVAAAGDV